MADNVISVQIYHKTNQNNTKHPLPITLKKTSIKTPTKQGKEKKHSLRENNRSSIA